MPGDPIVSIGFLTRRELERLGPLFTNHIPLPADMPFADLIAQLDQIEAIALSDGIAIVPSHGGRPE